MAEDDYILGFGPLRPSRYLSLARPRPWHPPPLALRGAPMPSLCIILASGPQNRRRRYLSVFGKRRGPLS